jgi:hypothetical protein
LAAEAFYGSYHILIEPGDIFIYLFSYPMFYSLLIAAMLDLPFHARRTAKS